MFRKFWVKFVKILEEMWEEDPEKISGTFGKMSTNLNLMPLTF